MTRNAKIEVYDDIPSDDDKRRFSNWAVVKWNKKNLGKDKGKFPAHDGTFFWVPFSLSSKHQFRSLVYMGVVRISVKGREGSSICELCSLQMMCAAEGFGYDVNVNCKADRSSLTSHLYGIERRKK